MVLDKHEDLLLHPKTRLTLISEFSSNINKPKTEQKYRLQGVFLENSFDPERPVT
jgi:hypothetical protein